MCELKLARENTKDSYSRQKEVLIQRLEGDKKIWCLQQLVLLESWSVANMDVEPNKVRQLPPETFINIDELT